ncbi:unnamed protein product [Symbiodinium natans]|uniref:LAGLIDADG endonuclease n=1 Tax=Symbiodinium natans TaxID=878477 RepID=A0A812JUC5_9DINO|nr:unnamed protein product [Symbiodinium natans]
MLKSFQSRLVWPPVTTFQAFGQTYALPFRGTVSNCERLPLPLLRYLAGFLDGDGCVSAVGQSCSLSASQSASGAEVLYLLATTLGGTVYVHARGHGLGQPSLQWIIRGHAAQKAACQLAPESVVKHQQLILAASWPSEDRLRLDAKQRLASLNSLSQYDTSHVSCSWAYIAGFFDAEGCIRACHDRVSVRMSLVQKNKDVLGWIDRFWRADLGLSSSWVVHKKSSVTEITVNRHSNTHLLMRRLLDNGLLLKQQQAFLGLSLRDVYYPDFRETMSSLSGNQARYQRLAEDGCIRATAIIAIRKRIRRCEALGRHEEVARLQQQLREMQQQHRVVAIFVTSPEEADEAAANKEGPLQGPVGLSDSLTGQGRVGA